MHPLTFIDCSGGDLCKNRGAGAAFECFNNLHQILNRGFNIATPFRLTNRKLTLYGHLERCCKSLRTDSLMQPRDTRDNLCYIHLSGTAYRKYHISVGSEITNQDHRISRSHGPLQVLPKRCRFK